MEAEESGCGVMELIIKTDTLKMEGKLKCVNLEDMRFEWWTNELMFILITYKYLVKLRVLQIRATE